MSENPSNNWDASFIPSGSVGNVDSSGFTETSTERPISPQQCKAKQHRKRHVMPGPAGVFFQQAQSSSLNLPSKRKRSTDEPHSCTDSPPADEEEEDDGKTAAIYNPQPTAGHDASTSTGLSFYSPAWMCMQIEFGYRTPSLPPHLTEKERYKIIRPFYPTMTHYLLPDLASGLGDWNCGTRSLMVLVQTSQALTDNLWTVTLTDETCLTMDAWIQPQFAKKEQQQNLCCQTIIQPGMVWLLQNVTVMVVASKDHKKRSARMLLIKEENIQQVWSPVQAEAIADSVYMEWAEQRNTLTAQAMQQFSKDLREEDDDKEEDEHVLDAGGKPVRVKQTHNDCSDDESDSSGPNKGQSMKAPTGRVTFRHQENRDIFSVAYSHGSLPRQVFHQEKNPQSHQLEQQSRSHPKVSTHQFEPIRQGTQPPPTNHQSTTLVNRSAQEHRRTGVYPPYMVQHSSQSMPTSHPRPSAFSSVEAHFGHSPMTCGRGQATTDPVNRYSPHTTMNRQVRTPPVNNGVEAPMGDADEVQVKKPDFSRYAAKPLSSPKPPSRLHPELTPQHSCPTSERTSQRHSFVYTPEQSQKESQATPAQMPRSREKNRSSKKKKKANDLHSKVKQPSSLWQVKDTSIIDMLGGLDGDSDGEEVSCNEKENRHGGPILSTGQTENTKAAAHPSLFQMGLLAGMNVFALSDDDGFVE